MSASLILALLIAPAAAQEAALTLDDLRRNDAGAKARSPFPLVLRIAVSPLDGLQGSADVQERVRDYFSRVSQHRFILSWESRRAFKTSAALDAIRIGSPEAEKLIKQWVRDAIAQEGKRPSGAVCLLVPRKGAVRGWFRWPHEGSVKLGKRRVHYYVAWPDSGKGETVGVHAHEIGHIAGLEDEYEHQDVKEGVWCVMSRGYLGGDPPGQEPAPPCAPCRVKLGWMPAIQISSERSMRVEFAPEDVCLSVDGSAIIERRGAQFLVWEDGRLSGIAGQADPVTTRTAEISRAADGLLKIGPRRVRSRRIEIP